MINYFILTFQGFEYFKEKYKYENFSKTQISSLVKLLRFLIKKYKIDIVNILGHSDISPERKKDPGEKFPWRQLAEKKLCFWHTLNEKKIKKFRNKNLTKRKSENFRRFCQSSSFNK